MENDLHTKYRPDTLKEVLGNSHVVASLAKLFSSKKIPHAFLFTGPSGTGKTTLARIIARELNTEPTEIDGARFSGIDNMRDILTGSQYTALTSEGRKVYIIDECHALGKGTWQTLLKSVEEPPEHVYFILCTTEPDKVPQTIRTRCHRYDLKPVPWEQISDTLQTVAKQEGLKIPGEIVDLAARKAEGSPRQGLVYLSMLRGIVKKEDALRILDEAPQGEEDVPIALARMLCKGCTWAQVQSLLQDAQDIPVEGTRLVVLHYATSCLKSAKSEKNAAQYLAVMDSFSGTWNPSEKLAPLYLAIGRLLLE